MSTSPIIPTARAPRVRRRAALATSFFALLGVLVLVPAPSFALEAASRLDREPLTLSAQAPTDQAVTGQAGPGATTTTAVPAPVDPTSQAARSAQAATPGRQRARAEGVAAFRLIAVKLHTTSTDPVLLRVHTAAGWGEWQSLDTDGADAPDAGTSEAAHGAQVADGATFSEPAWVGMADGYEVSLPSDATDATADLVRDTTRVAKTNGSQAGAAVVPTGGQPAINSRASWNARPSVEPASIAPTVRMAIVHHSVTANDYAPGDVPGILRSIQAFHIDGRGWNDIAYNFAVDKYGTIWEARGGGITNAVMGGHAKGANFETTGVVTLGDFTAAAPPQAMVNSIADLVGWKLYVHGTDPNGTNVFTLGENTKYPTGTVLTLPNVIGHRDVGSTGCPGDQLYPRLGEIRSLAGAKWQQQRSLPGFWPGVAIGANADGRPQVFAVGNDQQIYTQWQRTDGRWSGWLAMGGRVAGAIAVGSNADGRLQVFAVGVDGTLRTSWQVARNGTWSSVTSMGGHWSATAGIGLTMNRDGRMQASVLGDDGIWTTSQVAANSTWGGYTAIGGDLASFASLSMTANQDGRLEVFGLDAGGSVWHSWQLVGGGWSALTQLGGQALTGLATAVNQDGRIEVFAVGGNHVLYHVWQVARNASYSGWQGLGGSVTGTPSTVNDLDGRIEVLSRGTDNHLYDVWQTSPNGNWSYVTPLSDEVISGDPTVVRNRDGRLELFAPLADGTPGDLWQTTAGGSWWGWASFGGVGAKSLVGTNNASGNLVLFQLATDNAIYRNVQLI